jgi:hypothetical protein
MVVEVQAQAQGPCQTVLGEGQQQMSWGRQGPRSSGSRHAVVATVVVQEVAVVEEAEGVLLAVLEEGLGLGRAPLYDARVEECVEMVVGDQRVHRVLQVHLILLVLGVRQVPSRGMASFAALALGWVHVQVAEQDHLGPGQDRADRKGLLVGEGG